MEKEIREALLALSDIGGELMGIGEGLSIDADFILGKDDGEIARVLASGVLRDLENDLMEATGIVQRGLRVAGSIGDCVDGRKGGASWD